MKNEQQIRQRFDEITKNWERSDPAFTIRHILMRFLPFMMVRDVIKKDDPIGRMKDWEDNMHLQLTNEILDSFIRRVIKAGMAMAEQHRALDAKKNALKLYTLLWVKDDPLEELSNTQAKYPNFGLPILKVVGEKYGVDLPDSRAVKLMAQGKKCRAKCKKCNNFLYN